MTKEIMIEVGLSNLIILSIFCLMPFAMSTVANIYFLSLSLSPLPLRLGLIIKLDLSGVSDELSLSGDPVEPGAFRPPPGGVSPPGAFNPPPGGVNPPPAGGVRPPPGAESPPGGVNPPPGGLSPAAEGEGVRSSGLAADSSLSELEVELPRLREIFFLGVD